MQCNSVIVPSKSFKCTVASFRPEVDAAHAQHGAGQRRAVPELQLIGDVATSGGSRPKWALRPICLAGPFFTALPKKTIQ